MCVYSAMGDHYFDKWPFANPDYQFPKISPSQQEPPIKQKDFDEQFKRWFQPPVTKAEFEELKKEVLEMKEILKVAIEYDKRNKEPHCETEAKIATLRKVAALVGVDLDELFIPKPTSKQD